MQHQEKTQSIRLLTCILFTLLLQVSLLYQVLLQVQELRSQEQLQAKPPVKSIEWMNKTQEIQYL